MLRNLCFTFVCGVLEREDREIKRTGPNGFEMSTVGTKPSIRPDESINANLSSSGGREEGSGDGGVCVEGGRR